MVWGNGAGGRRTDGDCFSLTPRTWWNGPPTPKHLLGAWVFRRSRVIARLRVPIRGANCDRGEACGAQHVDNASVVVREVLIASDLVGRIVASTRRTFARQRSARADVVNRPAS